MNYSLPCVSDDGNIFSSDESDCSVYVPHVSDSESSSQELSDEETNDTRHANKQKHIGTSRKPDLLSDIKANDTVTCSIDCSDDGNMSDTIPVVEQSDSSGVHVFKSFKNSKGNLGNKIHFCLYCNKPYPNIGRHLTVMHKTETDIAHILALPKGSTTRRKEWGLIINKGDFEHNKEVLKARSGMIVTKYRSLRKEDVNKYVPCEWCKGFYTRKDLFRHRQRCQNRPTTYSSQRGEAAIIGRLMLPVPDSCEILYEKVILKMKDDDIKTIITKDKRIMEFGKRMCEKYSHKPHQSQFISQKLRELGRLLNVLQKKDEGIATIDECLNAKNWDKVVSAVKEVAGYDNETHLYQTPLTTTQDWAQLEEMCQDAQV